MTRRILASLSSFVVLAALALAGTALRAQSPAAPSVPGALTAADAKSLVGDWTIAADGPQGQMVMVLTVKTEGDKAVADLNSDMIGPSHITDIVKVGDSVTLRYSFDYQGNQVPAELTLTPAGDTLKAYFDFAGGAFTMPGVATRKKAS